MSNNNINLSIHFETHMIKNLQGMKLKMFKNNFILRGIMFKIF